MTNHNVIEVIHSLNDTTDTLHNRITSLKKHTHKDNIHLTPEGYKKVADSIITSAQILTSRPVQSPPCTTKGIEQVYWHGFTVTSGYGNKSRATPNPSYRGRVGVTTLTDVKMYTRRRPTCF